MDGSSSEPKSRNIGHMEWNESLYKTISIKISNKINKIYILKKIYTKKVHPLSFDYRESHMQIQMKEEE